MLVILNVLKQKYGHVVSCAASVGGVQVSLVLLTTEGKQADQSGVCSDAAPVPICRGKEGVELKGEVDLRFGHELLVMTKKK